MSQYKAKLIFVLTLMVISGSLIAQSSVHPNRYLITFESSATQQEIDQVMSELNSTEVWVAPVTETRLWEVQFPYLHVPTNDTIYNINQQVPTSQAKPKVNEVGYDYLAENEGIMPNSPTHFPCYMNQAIANGFYEVNFGIYDTGLNTSSYSHPGYYFEMGSYTEYDFMHDDPIADDEHGHGNHVRSSATHMINNYAAQNNNPLPYVNYDINKVFDSNGQGYLAEIIWAFENDVVDGLQIANFSWSIQMDPITAYASPLHTSLEKCAEQYGVLIICSAGNAGQNLELTPNPSYPAAYNLDHILTITSYNCENDIPAFANYGQFSVDIAIDGININGLSKDAKDVIPMTGTSQSAALVSGIAASLATHQSTFDALEIKCAIIEAAEYKSNISTKVVSKGIVDASTALSILGNCGKSNFPGGPGGIFKGGFRTIPLSPNPAHDKIELNFFNEAGGNGSLSIYGTAGQLMTQESFSIVKGENSKQIDVHNLTDGIYYLILDNNGSKESHRFVKM